MEEIKKDINKKAKPFLRWTGSKSWLVKSDFEKFIPKKFNTYHEPFAGGAAVFFHLQPKKAVINDINEELINCYLQIKNNCKTLLEELGNYTNSKEEYYRIRATTEGSKIERAARFIYLNRTSFNGIYRVNPQGKYNVPYGYRKNVDLLTEDNLKIVSTLLKDIDLKSIDFSKALDLVDSGDFVYLDPPYTVAHEHNGFLQYNSKLFSWEDQERLAESVSKLVSNNAKFVLSNAEHPSIRKLYKNYGEIHSLSRYSKVGGRKKTRGVFNEVVITNIDISIK